MIYTLATASALAFSPQAGVPASRAAVRNQLDISMMARIPLMAGNWKVSLSSILLRTREKKHRRCMQEVSLAWPAWHGAAVPGPPSGPPEST